MALPDWERLLAAERHLQAIVPGTVLVGGTAAALHAAHRKSLDGDHVLEDLRPRFDQVLAALEAAAGWETSRVQRPVAIMGRLDGVMTGIRQLRRSEALEVEEVAGLRVPTLAEMARIKAWLLATRHTVRDYLDTVVLLERLGEPAVPSAFARFDELYPQKSGSSALSEVAERLAAVAPSEEGTTKPGCTPIERDMSAFLTWANDATPGRAVLRHAPARSDLHSYKGLVAPWTDWAHLAGRGRHGGVLARGQLAGNRP